MSATVDTVRQDNMISFEIDGHDLKAPRGAMVIEAADAAGIEIPRFCYHRKLSVAANCRMCLVEVEKVPKPLPACATPVTEGMKVFTRSPKAIEAQRGIMEFLLINHPLDCPICDQGGECDLQEMSIGYGNDFSEYHESKRVVPDKNIGPLIATEMTRCIHCTRCVRFGDEIAGVRELGATGRGENTRIGTYIEQAVASEVSANIIDLCPVGALTSKPFRFTARAWEMTTRDGISAHDCIGSNLHIKLRRNEVMRVDPRVNEAINEEWLSDRDRFSYEGLHSDQRLLHPMIKQEGQWRETDWSTALQFAVSRLQAVKAQQGGEGLGALLSPNATLEEMYLLQKLMREMGSQNIDHRLRQIDFRCQADMPRFPALGLELAGLEQLDAALLIGSHVRKEQPIAALRLRKAAVAGAAIMFVNPLRHEFNFPVQRNEVTGLAGMEHMLAGVLKQLMAQGGTVVPDGLGKLLDKVVVNEAHRDIAARLNKAERGVVLLGNQAAMHPGYSTLCALAQMIARTSGARIGFLTEGANSAGAWLAGALPHRQAGGQRSSACGQNALEMLLKPCKAYVLLNIEPELDCADPAAALAALQAAYSVVALTPFRSQTMESYADVLLPVAPFTETSGTFVNVEGRWQSFQGVAAPRGEARPAWKVLRVLGNLLDLRHFDYFSAEEIRDEIAALETAAQASSTSWPLPPQLADTHEGLVRIAEVPLYAADNLVRRAGALQQTTDAGRAEAVICSAQAGRLGLADGARVLVSDGDEQVSLPLRVDERVPDAAVLIPQGVPGTEGLGRNGAGIELQKI